MAREELLQKIDELVEAGILSEEEAEIKKAAIEEKEAERLAKEKEEQEKAEEERLAKEASDKEKIDEILKQINEVEKADSNLDAAFEVLVPQSGKADTVAGELVRAAMRIIYRWYNDGDYFYEGYGLETAGPSACYLLETVKVKDILDLITGIVEEPYVKNQYTDAVDELGEMIFKYITKVNPKLLLEPNENDSRNWNIDAIEPYIPRYENDWELPDELSAHINKGTISVEDLVDEIKYWDYMDDDYEIKVEDSGWNDYYTLYVSGMDKEAYEETKKWMYKWLEECAEELTQEYGDPYFNPAGDVEVRDFVEAFHWNGLQEHTKGDIDEEAAAELLIRYLNEGEIWDDFEGKDVDEYCQNVVKVFTEELSKNIHEFDYEFDNLSANKYDIFNLLKCLGIIDINSNIEDIYYEYENEE